MMDEARRIARALIRMEEKEKRDTEKAKKKRPTKKKTCQYPAELQGLSSNKFGGNQLQNERGFRGTTYGTASPNYTYSKNEVEESKAEILAKYGQ